MFLGPSFDTMLPSNNFQAYGFSMGGEFLLSKDFGILIEYSKTHYYGSDKTGIFKNADYFFMGIGLLLSYHINISNNVEMYGAIGASYLNATGTFGSISILFSIDENKWVVIPAGKVGFRWLIDKNYAVRIGYTILRPISIGMDYTL
ncbi:MAG: hypothetical protein Q8L88_00970 [Bacteroidota bacterium]|nr:hypothetical protein [Bacteroidota bacterium]